MTKKMTFDVDCDGLVFDAEIKGAVYGRLTLTGKTTPLPKYPRLCEAVCTCGKTKFIRYHSMVEGRSKSCGCAPHICKNSGPLVPIRRSLATVWWCMKSRCSNPSDTSFPNYGGRGIKVCEVWDASFQTFFEWALLHGYKGGLTLDRRDNDGGYSPENCRWATASEQQRNTSRNVRVTAWGETKCLIEWAEDPRCLVKRRTAGYRLKHGMRPEEAFTLAPRSVRNIQDHLIVQIGRSVLKERFATHG